MTKSEIRDKQICLLSFFFLKLQAAAINFEKLLAWTAFKNPNFNPFQSSSVLPIGGSCCICYVNLPLKFQAVIFMFLLDLTGIL